MSLIWTQFPFENLDRVFDDAFNGSFSAARPRIQGGGDDQNQVSRAFRPRYVLSFLVTAAFSDSRRRMDVHESKENNLVTATFELPGLKKDDVTIDVHQGRLTVSGAVNTSTEETKDGYVVRERRSGKFTRELPLPQGVTAEKISAALNDGVLTVTFPKSTPEQETKRIAIN